MANKKICILSTVHPPFDVRIFHKEAVTLVKAGYEVLLIAPHDKEEIVDGVRIINLKKPANRIARMTKTVWSAFWKALKTNADIYHFHDPELIPAGLLLRLFRCKVIYDIHEDYVTSIGQKKYLPVIIKKFLRAFIGWIEVFSSKAFALILAEKYYSERFPSGTQILNYPILDFEDTIENKQNKYDKPNFIYTGVVSTDRGAYIHANVVNLMPEAEAWLIGNCDKKLASELYAKVGVNSNRLHIEGVGYFVPHQIISEYYIRNKWTAGLALFPPTEHYEKKELTKFFEYMAAGIPIIASNFPTWKRVIEGAQCGLCVNPLDPKAIADAMRWIVEHPEEMERMRLNGRRAVEEKFNWDKESFKLLEFYQRVIKA